MFLGYIHFYYVANLLFIGLYSVCDMCYKWEENHQTVMLCFFYIFFGISIFSYAANFLFGIIIFRKIAIKEPVPHT